MLSCIKILAMLVLACLLRLNMFIIIITMQCQAKVDEDNIYFDMVHIKISVLGCNIFAQFKLTA